MPKTTTRIPDTFDELLAALGNIDPRRVRLKPPPGQATVADVVRLNDRYGRLYELVDGTLVEKVMGSPSPTWRRTSSEPWAGTWTLTTSANWRPR